MPATPENTITPRREIKNYQIKSLINLRYTALTLGQAAPARPLPRHTTTEIHKIERHDRLGGLVHEYQQVA